MSLRDLRGRMRPCRSSSGIGASSREGISGRRREVCSSPELIEVTFDPGVSAGQRAYVLDSEDLFCRMCGAAPGDIDDLTGDRATFRVGLISDENCGSMDELSNLRTLCSTCNQGAKNVTTEKPSAIWLLSQVRRAGQEEQRTVLKWLLKKFKE
jgi:hypothetical protein